MKKAASVKARHILCEKHSRALAALGEIKENKRPFDKVAHEYSEDKARQGGSLGWITREKVVKEFADVAFGLEKSSCSAPITNDHPVKTAFGYHIIMVEDRR
ncbi:MAG: peptidyl-prolyl cis-trans isomerase (NIMA-interacting) [Amphiamblys sp. WSBS2006]|nr:MAG: peptidyl-prolyl cis-trans isomerase (NIMA-interacting) [Amphiamblys sp. WSBS2006]